MIQRVRPLRLLALSGAFVVLLAAGCGELEQAEEADEGPEPPRVIADVPEPPRVVKDRMSFIPYRLYGPLQKKMVGVLLLDARDITRGHEGRYGPDDELTFSTGGTSYRWVLMDEPKGIGRCANAADAKRWGITVPYALVEAEIDRESPYIEDESFNVKKMKRLDGTADYPLDLPRVVGGLLDRYRRHAEAQRNLIDSEMEAARTNVLKGRQATGPKRAQELMYLTWLPDRKRIKAAFRSRFERRARPEPTRGVCFGVELGMAYEVDVKGNVVATHELLPQRFLREIPWHHAGPWSP